MLESSPAKTPPSSFPQFRVAERVRQISDALESFLAVHPYIFLVAASLVYFSVTVYRAQRRLFWFDELFTFYIAQLPDLGSIWAACLRGADFNPPLFYFFTHWSQVLFGATELGTRIPQILGFWVFCLCLYRFVSVRAGSIAGFIALLFPLTTIGYWYAYEARPYGLVLGFFGLALVCWQAASGRTPAHWAALSGLGASLSGAVLCNCYAPLLLVPLGLGELTRTVIRKHLDARMWCALLLPVVVSVFTVIPLARAASGTIRGRISVPPEAVLTGWGLCFDPRFAAAVMLLLSAQAVALHSAPSAFRRAGSSTDRVFSAHEITVLIGLLCFPVFVFTAASIARFPVFGRYSLVVTAAVASLVGVACSRSRVAALAALLLSLFFIAGTFAGFYRDAFVREPSSGLRVGARPAEGSFLFGWIEASAPGNDPIVLMDDLEFVPMFHYGPPSLRSRFVFLVPQVNGEGYMRLQRCCGAPGAVISKPDFLRGHTAFFIYGTGDKLPKQLATFQGVGGRVTLQSCRRGHCLLRVAFSGHE